MHLLPPAKTKQTLNFLRSAKALVVLKSICKIMENPKENLFLEKFSLLNSQEHSEDINWSSSSSSDYEEASINEHTRNRVNKTRLVKRKRKKKVPKNISNLSIKIIDTTKENQTVVCGDKSPILNSKVCRKSEPLSPILLSSRPIHNIKTDSSPILTSKVSQIRSPILPLKTKSPKPSVKVRKKLFQKQNSTENFNNIENLDTNVCSYIKKEPEDIETEISSSPIIEFEERETNQLKSSDNSKAKIELVKRVKSFFDSHFSQNSSSASQNSISDIVTPKDSSKTSDEVEILTCKSQVLSNNSIQSLKPDSSVNSSESSVHLVQTSKKVKYKKDGLAFRLNNLLKKQNASLALWRHEKFLAANSSFVIPKGECVVFRIQKIEFQYGCHLLESVDMNDDKFLILIRSIHVVDNINSEMVLKLYEPYNVVQFNSDCKLIINVTKFECNSY